MCLCVHMWSLAMYACLNSMTVCQGYLSEMCAWMSALVILLRVHSESLYCSIIIYCKNKQTWTGLRWSASLFLCSPLCCVGVKNNNNMFSCTYWGSACAVFMQRRKTSWSGETWETHCTLTPIELFSPKRECTLRWDDTCDFHIPEFTDQTQHPDRRQVKWLG